MAGRVMPRDAENQKTTFADDDQQTVYNKAQDRNDNAELLDMKTYYQGDLPGDMSNIKDGTDPFDAISLSSGKIAFQEPIKASSLTAGTYTIAKSEQIADNVAGCTLRIVSESGIDLVEVDFKESGSAKTHQNTKVELFNTNFGKVRFVKSDSVNGAGSKIEIITNITTDLIVQIFSNSGTNKGFQLSTPVLTNNLCPDGSAATFLEAGEELSLNGQADRQLPFFACYHITSDDQILCTISWPEVPKQGSGLTFTPSLSGIIFTDFANNATTLGSFTISNVQIDGKTISFTINQTNIGLNLTDFRPCWASFRGSGGKLTIT